MNIRQLPPEAAQYGLSDLTFVDKQDYLTFVAEWKTLYKAISLRIRQGTICHKETQRRAAGKEKLSDDDFNGLLVKNRQFDIKQPMFRGLNLSRCYNHGAANMLALRKVAKVVAGNQREAARLAR
jgi:hypothetical protein